MTHNPAGDSALPKRKSLSERSERKSAERRNRPSIFDLPEFRKKWHVVLAFTRNDKDFAICYKKPLPDQKIINGNIMPLCADEYVVYTDYMSFLIKNLEMSKVAEKLKFTRDMLPHRFVFRSVSEYKAVGWDRDNSILVPYDDPRIKSFFNLEPDDTKDYKVKHNWRSRHITEQLADSNV
jgi:hypothetical protein